jgi:hypothetical protein
MNKTKAHFKFIKVKEKYPVITRITGSIKENSFPKTFFILSAERDAAPTDRLSTVQIMPNITSGIPDIFK